jgi:hypothetical protein
MWLSGKLNFALNVQHIDAKIEGGANPSFRRRPESSGSASECPWTKTFQGRLIKKVRHDGQEILQFLIRNSTTYLHSWSFLDDRILK